MIILAGHLKSSPEDVGDFFAALNSLAEATRREDGCLDYSFAIDDAAAGTVLVYERWRDDAALSAHLSQPAVLDVLGAWADKVDMSGIRKFDAANPRGFAD